MNALFYIGVAIAILTFIPIIILNMKMIGDRKKFSNTPIKLDEIRAEYRRKRFNLMIIQLAGIAIAIVALMC